MGDFGDLIMAMWPWLLILALMYLLFIRPQQKREKEREQMLQSLEVGDRVVTIGGIYGTIRALSDKSLTVEVGENVSLKMTRDAVAGTEGGEDDGAQS